MSNPKLGVLIFHIPIGVRSSMSGCFDCGATPLRSTWNTE